MSKTILITGGAGFIGGHLTNALHAEGYSVIVLDNFSPQIHGEDYTKSSLYNAVKDKAEIIVGSVTNRNIMTELIKKSDAIVHLAAETGTGQSMYDIERYTNVNVLGTAIMLDILTNEKKCNVRKLVLASSRAIYGEGKYFCPEHKIVYPNARISKDMDNGDFYVKCPICRKNVEMMATDEKSKIHPTSVYGLTKQTQEDMCLMVGQAIGLSVTTLRYQNVYGPGQSLKNPYTGILSIFSTQILNGNNINIFEDGTESRDFVFIDDVVNATVAAINNVETDSYSINIGTGKPISVMTVAEELIKIYNKDVHVNITGQYRIGDIRHNIADIKLAQQKLNYVPSVEFADGISRFAKWVKKQEIESDLAQKSFNEMRRKGLMK